MSLHRVRLLLGLAGIACGCATGFSTATRAPARPADIPVESFFRPPSVHSAALNPSGTHVGMLFHELKKDAHGLVFYNLAEGKISGLSGDEEYDVSSFKWSGDDRVVFSVARENRFAWGLYAMNRDNPKKVVTLNTRDVVEVLGSPRARPDNLLVWIRRSAREEGRPGGLKELDLQRNQRDNFGYSGNNVRRSIPGPPKIDAVVRWYLDRQGEIRYALAHDDGQMQLFRRQDDDRWIRLQIDLERDSPLAVDENPSVVFIAHRNEHGRRELLRLNTTDGSRGPALHTDEKYDFSAGTVRYSSNEHEVVGLIYARQATEQVWLRPEEASLQAAIDAALPPNRLNLLTSRSRDGKHLLVVSSSDRHPGALYVLDREKMRLQHLTDLAPWLPENLLASVRVMTYQARDGLKLDGYVTLPLGHDESRPASMIVLPHGGPWHRDVWGYDAESQFFASRGYLVFRPNYRGSSGYNDEISRHPRMEFRKMHEDVTDGVRALIAAKIADPAHIAIVGTSFGGYLSVCGAAFEPGLYKCAVSVAGVFDWERALKDDIANNPDSPRVHWLRQEFGNPKSAHEKLEAMSPYLHVPAIKIPVFIVHGEEDTNADTAQSRRLVKAMAKAGVPHESLFVKDEGHGFLALKNRVEVFTRIESFLKKHL